MLQILSQPTSMFSSAANRSLASCACRSISARLAASRWRWSSSCSAVSTTEVTIPGRQTTPPDVQTAPLPTRAAMSRISSASFAAPASASRRSIHRRRAGVGGLPRPGDSPALDPVRPEHGPEGDPHGLEHRALLDVELEVRRRRGELRVRVERVIEVDAACCERIGERDAVAVGEAAQLLLVAHRPGGGRGAEERAPEARPFLVGPVDEPYGHRRGSLLGDPPEHLRARDDVEAAVEPAAVPHRVDVAADQDGALRSRRGASTSRCPLRRARVRVEARRAARRARLGRCSTFRSRPPAARRSRRP